MNFCVKHMTSEMVKHGKWEMEFEFWKLLELSPGEDKMVYGKPESTYRIAIQNRFVSLGYKCFFTSKLGCQWFCNISID